MWPKFPSLDKIKLISIAGQLPLSSLQRSSQVAELTGSLRRAAAQLHSISSSNKWQRDGKVSLKGGNKIDIFQTVSIYRWMEQQKRAECVKKTGQHENKFC